MKHNSKQLNWILGRIEQKGFIIFDDVRNYFDDGKLSTRHMVSAKKSIDFLKRGGWLKKKRGKLIFTKIGKTSWRVANAPKFATFLVDGDVDFIPAEWNVRNRKKFYKKVWFIGGGSGLEEIK